MSYSRDDGRTADGLATALRNEGHTVFLDRDNLPAGEDFHARIRKWIADSDLFIFLVSPGSVSADRYAAVELDLAREKWPAPRGHVLPVVVSPVDDKSIPPYLLTVGLVKSGNVVPETLRAVAGIDRRARRQRVVVIGASLLVVLVLAVGVWKFSGDDGPAQACYLSASLEPHTSDSGFTLDTTYERDTNSFLVTGEGIASIGVGPLQSSTAQWTLELRSPQGESLGRQQVSGCPAAPVSFALGSTVHVTLTPR